MNLEEIMLNKISQLRKNILNNLTHMWNLKKLCLTKNKVESLQGLWVGEIRDGQRNKASVTQDK